MKDFFIKLSVLCISLLVGILMCEGLIRLMTPQRLAFVRALYDPDEDLIFKLRKNYQTVHAQTEFNVVETTNSMGFRDREFGPKTSGTLRVLALGDSYGFGHGVTLEETYAKQLESMLNGVADRPVEVINAGVPAYSLVQEVRYLQKHGKDLAPDVVLVGFFIGNDFMDSYELYDAEGKPVIGVSNHLLVSRKERDKQTAIRGQTTMLRWYLATHSHLYTFLRDRSSELLLRMGLRQTGHGKALDFCDKNLTPQMQAQWEYTQKLLKELAETTRAHNQRLAITLIPLLYQVNEEIWQEYASVFHLDPARYDMDQPQRLMKAFCAQQNIDCVDLLDVMREHDAPLFYRIDGHMNAEGHRVTALTLTSYFTELMNAGTGLAGQDNP